MVLSSTGSRPKFNSLAGWSADSTDAQRAAEMLLTHQAGSVHVGEVVRFVILHEPSIFKNDCQCIIAYIISCVQEDWRH